MSSSYFSGLIEQRYPSQIFSVAQAKKDAGLRLEPEGGKKATAVVEGITEIEIKLRLLEAELFVSSEQYKLLVQFENSWKRLQIEVAKSRINNEKTRDKKRRIEVEDNKSQEVDAAANKKSQEVGVKDFVSEKLLNRERDRCNQLQLILAENTKWQTEFLNSSKEFADQIEKKVSQIDKVQMRKKPNTPPSTLTGQHSNKSEEENDSANPRSLGGRMLAALNKDKRIPSGLGIHEQGISAAILEIPGSRRSKNTDGLGSDIQRASSRHYTDPITFQPARLRHVREPIYPQPEQYTNASSTSTSSRAYDLRTTFGSILFAYNLIEFKCYFVIDLEKECSTSYGSYGVVICPKDKQVAYKLVFCQDSAERHVIVSINDQSNGSSRYMRTSSYRDIIYESEANKILAENDILKKLCILVDGKLSSKYSSLY